MYCATHYSCLKSVCKNEQRKAFVPYMEILHDNGIVDL